MSSDKFYNAKEVVFIWGPYIIDSGFADGAFITVTPVSDAVDTTAGADGEVAFSVSNDRRATIELSLMSTSKHHGDLMAAYTAGITAPGGVGGIQPLAIRNPNGGEFFTAQNVMITKAPTVTYDKTATTRTWTFTAGHLIRGDAGADNL